MDTKVPSILTDPSQMARAVWEYWITTLKTDGTEGSEDMPDWDEMGDEEKESFVEAFRTQIVNHVEDFVEAVQFEDSLDEAFDAAKPTPPTYTDKHIREAQTKGDVAFCYICNRVGVSAAGKVCARCYFSHVNPQIMRREKRG